MKRAALFGLLALIPAAAPAPVAALAAAVSGTPVGALSIRVADCSGSARTIEIPRDPQAPAPREADRDCFKGCHAGASRKRFTCAC